MSEAATIIAELARVKAEFQLRAIAAVIGAPVWTRTHYDRASGETITTIIDPADIYITPPATDAGTGSEE